MDVQSHWLKARQLTIRFCCLRRNHTSDCCARSKLWGIDGYQRMHNRLLHGGLVTRNDFADDQVNHGLEITDQEPEKALVTEMGHSQSGNVPASPSMKEERRVLNESSSTTTVMTSKPPEQAHFVVYLFWVVLGPRGF